MGGGIELDRRNVDPAGGVADPAEGALAQAGEECPEDRAGGTGVVECRAQGRAQRLAFGCLDLDRDTVGSHKVK